MQTLEQNLEARLFDRRAQGYGLTQQGETLLEFAEKMEELARSIVTQVGQSKAMQHKTHEPFTKLP